MTRRSTWSAVISSDMRLVREHEPVTEDVEGEVADVGRERVVAAADEGQRSRGEDHADRGARAGAEADVASEVAEPDGVRLAGGRW